MKIRVLAVTTSDRMAGAEKNIFDLLRSLDKDKYQVKLVILKHESNGFLKELCQEIGIPAEIIGIQSKWQVYKIIHLWNIIRKFHPDILESFLFFDNQVTRIMGRLLGVKIIISGLQNIEVRRPWWRNLTDRLTVPLADAVISNSDAGANFYINQGYVRPEKVFIAKSGIDTAQLFDLQSVCIRNDDTRIIFGISIPKGFTVLYTVGFLTTQKGTKHLIRALKILKDHGRNIICFIAGEGDLLDSLKQQAENLGISDSVHFLGYQKASYQYLPLVDLFVLPSLWEGLPNVIIEAMASHTLVVATDVGGVSEIVKDEKTGFLAIPGDPEILAQRIERALDLSKEDRVQIVEAAYQHIINNFSVESMVKKYTECYEHFLE